MPHDFNNAQEFCKSLPWKKDWKWFDKTAILPIDDKRRAKIEISIRCCDGYPTVGSYNGFELSIVDKDSGVIEARRFSFRDYLAERADDRASKESQYHYENRGWFGVIDHCGWGWYIAVPKHPEKFTEAVERYIDMFV
jgi:hypothetical protein